MNKEREAFSLFKSLVALALIVLCLIAAHWQYNRGIDRQERNAIVKARITQEAVSLRDISMPGNNPENFEWRMIRTVGQFDESEQIINDVDNSR